MGSKPAFCNWFNVIVHPPKTNHLLKVNSCQEMKSPPPWSLQNKSFPRTPSSESLGLSPLLCFLLLCNQGGQSQPPDLNNIGEGSKPDGVGVAEGGGVDVLPGKEVSRNYKQPSFPKWVDFPMGMCVCVWGGVPLFCILFEKNIHVKLLLISKTNINPEFKLSLL